jgi:fructokinase
MYGAIEAGGTKFVCAIARAPHDLVEQARIDTTAPMATLAAVVEFFADAQRRHGELASFGIGTFGPVELDRGAPGWGRILPTPKPGWTDADLVTPLRQRFGVPVAIDTDVNAAALAEWQLGAGQERRSLAYVTVGTGIGGGFIVDGKLVHGLMHPEVGHLLVRRDPRDAEFAGTCPFHGDCLEGLACGRAITARWGRSLSELPAEHEGSSIIAGYLGQLVANIALMLSSERVVLGGGVMQHAALLPLIRASTLRLLNGYLPHPELSGTLTDYVCAPGLGDRSGITGAVLLAQAAALRR